MIENIEQIEPKEFHPLADQLKKSVEGFKKEEKAPEPAKTEEEPKINLETKEEIKAEAVPAAEENPKETEQTELNEPEFSFGDPETKEEVVAPPTELLKKIGGALDFGDLKDEQELISKVNELRTERDNLKKSAESSFEGLPDALKEAVEAAKKGADWYSLIGYSVDYSKADPIQVFEYEYEQQLKHRYQTPDGKIDYEKLDADLDSFPEAEKVMRGNDIIRQKSAEQATKKAEVLYRAEKEQQAFNSRLAESTKNINKIFPKERYGVNFEQKHTEYIYSGISSRNLVKKHLGNIDESTLSRLDTDKLARTIAAAELVGNISEFRYKQGQVDKARELLKSSTNAQLETPAIPAKPEVSGEKQLTPQERLAQYYDQFRGNGRL